MGVHLPTTEHGWHMYWSPRPLGPLLLTLFVLLLAMSDSAAPVLAQAYGTRIPGQHVYDRAGILSQSEIAELERQASLVEEAGAPVVVYIQVRDADDDDTQGDARNLMEAWDVQSSPGARDGLVIFVNLDPD